MKKILYSILFLAAGHIAVGQNATANKNPQLLNTTKSVSDQSYQVNRINEINIPDDNESFYKTGTVREGGDFVGNTSYDLPTNGCAPGRLLVYGDGTVSVAWTGSLSFSDTRPDRGTFYNHYDGSSWGPIPDERIESYRTGFPVIINVGDHEMFFAHDGSNNIAIFENDEIGSSTWTEDPNSLAIKGTWPRAFCEEGSNYIHVLVANDDPSNKNDYVLYYRSSDAGATWDINGYRLPGIDTLDGYNVMGAEVYAVQAIGSNVYITAGSSINDLAVWKSTSNGDIGSWTKTRILEFPQPNFDGNTISDITGDGVADTLVSHDGEFAMVIDNSGMMHVWAGVTRILDVEADDNAWTYFPGTVGLWYWNESFGADSVQYLDFTLVDWDNDGDPFAGIGADLPNYGCGYTSMPTATIDRTTGIIYVGYTQMIEYTDYFEDPTVETAQSFRDIFGFYTTDEGLSWSSPINLTYVAEQHFENVNPTFYWSTVDDKVHTLWMQDMEPGNSLETEAPDPITIDNDILYRGFDYDRFEPYDPTADYSYTATTNFVTFDNLSFDASEYLWDFGDGTLNNLKDPTHVYTTTGNYNVCLTATNVYGDDQACKMVTITEISSIDDELLSDQITVFPTITSGNITIQTTTDFDDLEVELLNMSGQLLSRQKINSTNTEINLSEFASGTYLLKFVSHSAVTIKQVSLVN